MPEANPISEQIAANVVSALQDIDGTGEYYTALSNVIRTDASLDDITFNNLEAVVIDESIAPDKDKKAPWGQQEWIHAFGITVFIKQAASDPTPISTRINLARADVERALFVDPRRDGLCYVDNKIFDVGISKNQTSGIYGFTVVLLCEYRTMRGQPNVLAPAGNNEQYFQGGAVLLLAPYISQRQIGAWRRLQDLRIVPALDPQTETISTDRNDGLTRPTDTLYSGHKLKFTIEADYQNQDILAWRFGGSGNTVITQSAQTVSATVVVNSVDSVIPVSLLPIQSVQSVGSYVAGTDYIADAVSLSQGIILIPPGSRIPAPCAVTVNYTIPTITSRPAFNPAKIEDARHRARIIWIAADGQQLVFGDFDASIVATISAADAAAINSTTFMLTVLDDGSGTPAGQLISVAGPLPTAGY